jgi:hypothetical protein
MSAETDFGGAPPPPRRCCGVGCGCYTISQLYGFLWTIFQPLNVFSVFVFYRLLVKLLCIQYVMWPGGVWWRAAVVNVAH